MQSIRLRVIFKGLIRSKSSQNAVARLPHIVHILTIIRQPLTLSYSLIEGEYDPPPLLPQAEKVVVVKKNRKLNLRGLEIAPLNIRFHR